MPHTLSLAIAEAEGFNVEDSLPARCNNPGDLELGDLGFGVIDGKTIFPSLEIGWQYLDRQSAKMLSGQDPLYPSTWTLYQAGMRYSGQDPNWPKNVAASLGIAETTTLSQMAALT